MCSRFATESLVISKSALSGQVQLPSSKSQSLRAILFASLAQGRSNLTGVLDSPDVDAMVTACRQLGAQITRSGSKATIEGCAGKLSTPSQVIDCGNSGIVLRFISAISALQSVPVEITGDDSIQSRRPLAPLLSAIKQLGGDYHCLEKPDYAPVKISGPIQAGRVDIEGQDSQPVSALLIACTQLAGISDVTVRHAGERPWLALTVAWLKRLDADIEQNGDHFCIQGPTIFKGFDYHVPGDLSSMAFPLVAALVTRSELVIEGVDLGEPQGDKKILSCIRAMGGEIIHHESQHKLMIPKQPPLHGAVLDLNDCIDALPALAVLSCFATSPTTLTNIGIARSKESDRLSAMSDSLQRMGAQIDEGADQLTIYPSELHGAKLHSHHDHRIAMALSVAGMMAEGQTVIKDVGCIAKTFPRFAHTMQSIGAEIRHNSIVLCGMKYAGKSTLGSRLAADLELPLVDTDEQIIQTYAKQTGEQLTVAEIHHKLGEEAFRQQEAQVVRQLKASLKQVISVGGGTPTQCPLHKRLKQQGTVIYLYLDQKTAYQRLTQADTLPSYFPTLPSEEEYQAHYHKRDQAYRQLADQIIDCSGLDSDQSYAALKQQLEQDLGE